ncbi:protein RETICULATA-RELATED 1, chloroplastic-like [Miscanthus floridulus]|uniref:protein RETICULATA-RELATED 1, chloroplastic-like n=1 Tax=Miscanthus floridulus TaxID=154761 RepID=UPI0034587620
MGTIGSLGRELPLIPPAGRLLLDPPDHAGRDRRELTSTPSAPPPLKTAQLISLLPKPHSLSCSTPHIPRAAVGDGSGAGNHGDDSSGNGGKDGGSGGGGEDDDDYEDAEFGPLLGFDVEAAKDAGIRCFDLQVLEFLGICLKDAAPWPLGVMLRVFSMLRKSTLADPSFLFKVGTEIVIDSCYTTFVEVQKRRKDFWAEFELYAADLLVSVAVDIALVGLLAPYVRIEKPSASTGLFGRFSGMAGSLRSR